MADLQCEYECAVEIWTRLRAAHPALSAPHLVDVHPRYFSMPTRLMVVGQETLGWGEMIDPTAPAPFVVTSLRTCYREFDLGSHYRRSPFWVAANQVFHALNPDAIERAFIWSNLVKMDNERKRPEPALEEVISEIPLLRCEISTWAPDVIVFFTGPRYDERLRRTFPGAELNAVTKEIAEVMHPSLPRRTLRTYHPSYLRRSRRWKVLDELASYCQVGGHNW